MIKTRKSVSKRFKITKSGKVLHRPTGQNHFRAKKSGKKIRQSRGWIEMDKTTAKQIKKMMSFTGRKKSH
jgi:large subunit ribosomal protein L35